MSVLNQSGEEQVECPLCMEPLEVDDLNFFPCTCGYQICRFCWHRIRTDENGLCPACRKAYSEDPADFTPLSQEQVAKLKAEKRQRDQQRKAKLSESRKHLASVRVVQRNLVFVVGLPMRLADPEVLKRHEYFGKFGKIHKVVINQSTSYAGSQGPSASAYVTYMKSDDALRAIQSVNNVTIDGRLIKSSLGTTKYCSHFMKNQPCPKPDCMYLHDFGDPEASFTKEQMHAGKHQEYEKKLHEALLQRTTNNNVTTTTTTTTIQQQQHNSNGSNGTEQTAKSKSNNVNGNGKDSKESTNKENWPQLNSEKDGSNGSSNSKKPDKIDNCNNGKEKKGKSKSSKEKKEKKTSESSSSQSSVKTDKSDHSIVSNKKDESENSAATASSKLSILDDNTSFFSHNSFQKITPPPPPPAHQLQEETEDKQPPPTLTDALPDINTSEDWAAAFGFNKLDGSAQSQTHQHNDESVIDSYFRNAVPVPSVTTSENAISSSNGSDFRNIIEAAKLQDNIRDVLTGVRSNGYVKTQQQEQNYFGKESGLDQHMSKFFVDFHQKNGHHQKDGFGMNGFTAIHQMNNYFVNSSERLLLLQQKKLEEHLMNLSLKQQQQQQQQSGYGYMNGDLGGGVHQQNGYGGGYHAQSLFQHSQSQQMAKTRTHSEDELDFDPFQETQKALAELIANEQNNYKTHSSNVRGSIPTGQMNGVVHGQSGKNHLPPPPPGFVQPTTHMNSFGSKILPFLNMSNSQQISPTTPNWPSYNPTQVQQHKNLNSCNDWKDFDSAIVTTSRHYPLNMPPIRDHFTSLQQQLGTTTTQQQIPNGSLRSHEYTNNAFSNFTQQLQQQQQPNFNNYSSHINSSSSTTTTQPNLNWFTSELNSQISSPPGFRTTNQTSKQQEC